MCTSFPSADYWLFSLSFIVETWHINHASCIFSFPVSHWNGTWASHPRRHTIKAQPPTRVSRVPGRVQHSCGLVTLLPPHLTECSPSSRLLEDGQNTGPSLIILLSLFKHIFQMFSSNAKALKTALMLMPPKQRAKALSFPYESVYIVWPS